MKPAWIVTTIALVAMTYTLTSAQQSSRGPTKVAFVSGSRVIGSSPEMRAALGRLQATQQQKLAELQAKQRALQETKAKADAATNAAAKTELIKQQVEQEHELQRLAAQSQTDIQASQREAQTQLQAQLRPVLDDVAKGQGIEVVLNSDVAVFWGATALDITPAVIERLKAKPAAPAAKP